MTIEPDFAAAPPGALSELICERWRSGGYVEGWQWILEVGGDPGALRDKVVEIKEKINDPLFANNAMAPGSSPRLYQDGFLRAVTTALKFIDAAERDAAEQPAG